MRLFFYSFILLFLICGGTSFAQVIVPAFHGVYTSKASAVVFPASCGAYVAAGVYKEFMCHNLGADTSLDPHVPVQGIHGNYYQWGRIAAVANATTAAGVIAKWNNVAEADGAWSDASKTANDPCPAGYRVPNKAQWEGVIAKNDVSRSGSWVNDGNFTTAIHFGTGTTKTLTLPAHGYRIENNGMLYYRGYYGLYWSTTINGDKAYNLAFLKDVTLVFGSLRAFGFPIRCVSE